MKKQLNCILLIDDDEPTNFLHTLVAEESGIAERVISVQSGHAALQYLTTEVDGQYPQPDLIFLDINMPRMNGWEFLERYKALEVGQQGGKVVIMLTTSLNPDDEEKAQEIGEINGFLNKPLTVEMIQKVVDQYFPSK